MGNTAALATAPDPDVLDAPGIREVTSPRWAVLLRWLMVAGWVAVIVGTLADGGLRATHADLERHLVSGKQVTLSVDDLSLAWEGPESRGGAGSQSGDAQGRDSQGIGFSTVEVAWHENGVERRTDYKVRAEGGGPKNMQTAEEILERWKLLSNGRFQSTLEEERAAISTVRDWFVPVWVGWTYLVLGVMTLVHLAVGPAPLRLTKWGWFWTFAVPAVGALAYWLLGEVARWGRGRQPIPGVTAPRPWSGWAGLMIALAGSAVLGSLLGL